MTQALATGERLLVVDDEPDIAALVTFHLIKAGYRVSTAANGPDAIAQTRQEHPVLVVLDLMLPGMSGYEVLEQLRADDATRDVAVLMLTARKEEQDRIRGLSLGADDYLTKPFSPQELRARVRVIAATNRDPQQAVRDGQLREDLMYRLAVFPIEVPPLRERDGDAELLAEHFLQQLNEAGHTRKAFSRQAITVIRSYRWPGNVRELKNAVQRAYIMSDDTMIDIDFVGTEGVAPVGECLRVPVGTPLAEIERQAIHSTLDLCEGNKRRCAEMLGVSLKTLYNRLAEYQSAPAAI